MRFQFDAAVGGGAQTGEQLAATVSPRRIARQQRFAGDLGSDCVDRPRGRERGALAQLQQARRQQRIGRCCNIGHCRPRSLWLCARQRQFGAQQRQFKRGGPGGGHCRNAIDQALSIVGALRQQIFIRGAVLIRQACGAGILIGKRLEFACCAEVVAAPDEGFRSVDRRRQPPRT